MNEGTFENPDWKEDYDGANYGRLLEIKRKYDPYFILYGPASVGSDYWAVVSEWKAMQGSLRTERNDDGADSCSHAIALTTLDRGLHSHARLLVRTCDMTSQKNAKRHQMSRRKLYEAVVSKLFIYPLHT